MSGSAARMVIVTSGNYFAWRAIHELLTHLPAGCHITVVRTSLMRGSSGSRFSSLVRAARGSGLRFFFYRLLANALPRALALARPGTCTNVHSGCRNHGIADVFVADVNTPEGVSTLAALRPDMLVSISCPYILSEEVLKLARIGAANLHSSLLPLYAGVSTYVHALANAEERVGMTLHEMVPRVDAGRVLDQVSIRPIPGDSVFEVFETLCRLGGLLLVNALDRVARGVDLQGWEQDLEQRSYFGEPCRSDVARVRENGYSLVAVADVVRLCRGTCRHG